MTNRQMMSIVLALLVLILLYASVFTVNEKEQAIKFKLGEIVKSNYKPGLHFQWPFVNNVIKYESRILTLDVRPTEYLTKEKKRLVVDFFAKWRINEVEKFYRTMRQGNMNTARQRVFEVINNGLKSQFSQYNLTELVSGTHVKPENEQQKNEDIRAKVMTEITRQANVEVEKFGISIVDIRIKRIDLTSKISRTVFDRMISERAQFAADIRARGKEASERRKADADKQRTIELANAYKDAQQIRGDGDAKAAEIYAKAYSQDREFYAFYRSLDAYKASFAGKDDILVIEPNSDFFNYFKQNKKP